MSPGLEWPKVYKHRLRPGWAAARFGADPRVYQTTVKRFGPATPKGGLKELVTVRIRWEKNAQGHFTPVEEPGSEETRPAQLVLLALGFLGPEQAILKEMGVECDARSNVKAEHEKYSTNLKGVFAAGDCRRGQSLVVWAINEGRGAAPRVRPLPDGEPPISPFFFFFFPPRRGGWPALPLAFRIETGAMPSKPIPGSTGEVLTCLPSPYRPHPATGLLYLPRFLAKCRYVKEHGAASPATPRISGRGLDRFLCSVSASIPMRSSGSCSESSDEAEIDRKLAQILLSDVRAEKWEPRSRPKGDATPAGQDFLARGAHRHGLPADRVGEIKSVPDLLDFDEGRIE